MKWIALGLLVGFAVSVYAIDRITLKGSDTMVILAQRWAERYMDEKTGVSIQVTGGGSGTGIAALINGTTDICNSSRPISREEILKIKERYGTSSVQITVARDGLLLYLHKENPISSLTLKQIQGIYTGRIRNWKEIGGDDHRVIVYGRENNSGTFQYFIEEVLKGEPFDPTVQSLPGTAAVVNAVANDKHGIGYGGSGYASGVKVAQIEGISPTEENVMSGQYPISRDLYMYLRFQPTGKIKEFIDWVLSPEGQRIVEEIGYYPVR